MFKPAHSSHTPITSVSVQRTHFVSSKYPSVLDLYSIILLSAVGLHNEVFKRRPRLYSYDRSSCTAYFPTLDWLHCFYRSAILAVACLSGTSIPMLPFSLLRLFTITSTHYGRRRGHTALSFGHFWAFCTGCAVYHFILDLLGLHEEFSVQMELCTKSHC
jgi:hypothetical protein